MDRVRQPTKKICLGQYRRGYIATIISQSEAIRCKDCHLFAVGRPHQIIISTASGEQRSTKYHDDKQLFQLFSLACELSAITIHTTLSYVVGLKQLRLKHDSEATGYAQAVCFPGQFLCLFI
jgi:hypothetical protein